MTVTCLLRTSKPLYACAGITYSVTAGKSLQAVYLMAGGTGSVGLSCWIIMFAVSELFASQVCYALCYAMAPCITAAAVDMKEVSVCCINGYFHECFDLYASSKQQLPMLYAAASEQQSGALADCSPAEAT